MGRRAMGWGVVVVTLVVGLVGLLPAAVEAQSCGGAFEQGKGTNFGACAAASPAPAAAVSLYRRLGGREGIALVVGDFVGNMAADARVNERFKAMWRLPENVLAQVRRDNLERLGQSWSEDDAEAFKAPIRDQYESQGHPYYASARLWDDGIIDPAQTRTVLALGLSAALNAPIERTEFGVFRM